MDAKEIIVKFCKEGNILAKDYKNIETFGNMAEDIDVFLAGKHFKSMTELNKFVEDSYVWWKK